MAMADHTHPSNASESLVNVGSRERLLSAIGGAAVFGYGLSRRNGATPLLLFLGGLLVARGVSGKCALYDKLQMNTNARDDGYGVPDQQGIRVENAITVKRSPAQVYDYWRQLRNLPNFMPHLRSVAETDSRHSHWVVEGPAGQTVEWDAEIINEHPGEMIAWQTLPGAQVQSAGTVRFEPVQGGTETLVTVLLRYAPPAGELGATVAKILGEAPDQQLKEDLVRFKQLLETDSDAGAL